MHGRHAGDDGSSVSGVLVFAGLEVRETDAAFMQALPVLGSLIGQFVQRKLTEQQRRALQAQLYQSQKLQALGTLAGGIAHEFNNMIAAIIGNASLASQDIGDNPAARESLDQITASAERARALTRRILMFGRAQADTRTSTMLAPVVEDVMRLLRATLPVRITLTFTEGAATPPVRADGTQLHQLIVNLCTNAAHAIGNNQGSIEISLTTTPAGRVMTALMVAGVLAAVPAGVAIAGGSGAADQSSGDAAQSPDTTIQSTTPKDRDGNRKDCPKHNRGDQGSDNQGSGQQDTSEQDTLQL